MYLCVFGLSQPPNSNRMRLFCNSCFNKHDRSAMLRTTTPPSLTLNQRCSANWPAMIISSIYRSEVIWVYNQPSTALSA